MIAAGYQQCCCYVEMFLCVGGGGGGGPGLPTPTLVLDDEVLGVGVIRTPVNIQVEHVLLRQIHALLTHVTAADHRALRMRTALADDGVALTHGHTVGIRVGHLLSFDRVLTTAAKV